MSIDGSRKGWAKSFSGMTTGADKLIGGQTGQAAKGRNHVPRGTPVPTRGSPTANNYTDRYAKTAVMAVYHATGGVTIASKALYALVYTPSTRLRARINIFFEPSINTGSDPVFNVVPTWEIHSMGRHPISGYESPLQQLYPVAGFANLPDEFTVDSAGELLRVHAIIDSSQWKIAYAPLASDVTMHLTVTWEPNTYISPEDLRRYYESCRISTGQVFQIANNTIP